MGLGKKGGDEVEVIRVGRLSLAMAIVGCESYASLSQEVEVTQIKLSYDFELDRSNLTVIPFEDVCGFSEECDSMEGEVVFLLLGLGKRDNSSKCAPLMTIASPWLALSA